MYVIDGSRVLHSLDLCRMVVGGRCVKNGFGRPPGSLQPCGVEGETASAGQRRRAAGKMRSGKNEVVYVMARRPWRCVGCPTCLSLCRSASAARCLCCSERLRGAVFGGVDQTANLLRVSDRVHTDSVTARQDPFAWPLEPSCSSRHEESAQRMASWDARPCLLFETTLPRCMLPQRL